MEKGQRFAIKDGEIYCELDYMQHYHDRKNDNNNNLDSDKIKDGK